MKRASTAEFPASKVCMLQMFSCAPINYCEQLMAAYS